MLETLDAAILDVEARDVDVLALGGLGEDRDIGARLAVGVGELAVVHVEDEAR